VLELSVFLSLRERLPAADHHLTVPPKIKPFADLSSARGRGDLLPR
jgi:hypothetical protein